MAADGFIQMDTEMVEPVMHGLTGTGEELDVGWKSCRAQVDSGEAGIGADVLGQAFRGGYEAAGAALRGTAGTLPSSLRAAAGNGMACCADYLAADARAAAGMPAAGMPAAGMPAADYEML
jgi:hypothetical protein